MVAKGNQSVSVSKKCLIIFYRNPELGKVKTRLAATLGDDKALAIYMKLASHTMATVESLPLDKIIYYSHHIDREDNFSNQNFEKKLQVGVDLGERMSNAVKESFSTGYQSVCIIGTDCFELNTKIVEDAFRKLKNADTVIGPAEDGGYYLLGMNKYLPDLFKNKVWSTTHVLNDTLEDIKRMKLSYVELPTLNDVDEESDLPEAFRKIVR